MTDFPLDVGKFPPSMRYAVNTADPSESPFTHEDCDDPRAAVKVVQRFDGTTDASQCSPVRKAVLSQSRPIACGLPQRRCRRN